MRLLSRPTVGLFVVGLGTIAAPLDSAVNIAFPSITRAFDLQVQDIRWIVIAYVLTYASLMLVFGRLGDLLGYRRIFQLGLLVSAAGFAACSLAPTYPLLLLGRMLQGVGIALTLSCAPALAISLFEDNDRTRVLGVYAAITAVGSALGPLVGGFLVERCRLARRVLVPRAARACGPGAVLDHPGKPAAGIGARLRCHWRRAARHLAQRDAARLRCRRRAARRLRFRSDSRCWRRSPSRLSWSARRATPNP